MDYYFYLTIFTRGQQWAIIWLFFGGEGGGGWGAFFGLFFCFWQNNNIAQIIVFERFGVPEKGL